MVSFFFIRYRKDSGDLIGAIDPELLVLIEKCDRLRDHWDVRVHELLPSAALLGDKSCPLEHGHVLLHSGEAHVVLARQRGHRLLVLDGTSEDVATRAIGERLKDAVDVNV